MSNKEPHPISEVICAGHICLDITPIIPDVGYHTIQEIFRPGRLVNVDAANLCPGGPVANVGLSFARLGVKTGFMTKVGADYFGKIILDYLKKVGAVEGVSQVADRFSSYSIVLAPPGIDRLFLHHSGTNDDFTSSDVDFDVVKQAKLFHFGYPPNMQAILANEGDELVKLFRLVKQQGVTTSLDMSMPDPNSYAGKVNWRNILERVLPYVDIFLPSIEEAIFCLDPGYFKEVSATRSGPDFIDAIPPQKYSHLADLLLRMGTKFVVLKAAHRGFYMRTAADSQLYALGNTLTMDVNNWANREIWCPSFKVREIVNATGAGDATIAGFLTSVIKGLRIERAVKTAVCVGFQSLHTADASSGIRPWDETQNLLNTGKLKINEVDLEIHGWYWDKPYAIWLGPNDRMIIK